MDDSKERIPEFKGYGKDWEKVLALFVSGQTKVGPQSRRARPRRRAIFPRYDIGQWPGSSPKSQAEGY